MNLLANKLKSSWDSFSHKEKPYLELGQSKTLSKIKNKLSSRKVDLKLHFSKHFMIVSEISILKLQEFILYFINLKNIP